MISREIDLTGHCRPRRVSGQTNCVPSEAQNAKWDQIKPNTVIVNSLTEAVSAQMLFRNLQNHHSTEPSATDTSTLSP